MHIDKQTIKNYVMNHRFANKYDADNTAKAVSHSGDKGCV